MALRESVLVIGAGRVGSFLANEVGLRFDIDSLSISNDGRDLNSNGILVKTDILNPSVKEIRSAASRYIGDIRERISNYSNIMLIGSLGGNTSTALLPLVAEIAKEMKKNVYSFVIMPFRFEKGAIFQAGVVLRHIRERSECTVILDNDALLHNNPDLTLEECYSIMNDILIEAIASLLNGKLERRTIIACSSKERDPLSSLKGSLKMLYEIGDPAKVEHAVINIISKDIPVGLINEIAEQIQGVTGAPLSVTSGSGERGGLLLFASLEETKFSRYDPLSIIPSDSVLDWALEHTTCADIELARME